MRACSVSSGRGGFRPSSRGGTGREGIHGSWRGSFLLLAELLEQGVFVDVDGRHLGDCFSSLGPGAVLVVIGLSSGIVGVKTQAQFGV